MITVDHAGENMITVAPGANHEVSTADIAAAAPLHAASRPRRQSSPDGR